MGFDFLIAIALAVFVMGATLWSAGSAAFQKGPLRQAQAAALASVIAGMSALSLGWPLAGQIAGLALLVSAAMAFRYEPGVNKFFPMVHIAYALALLTRLPFTGWGPHG